MRIIKPGKDAAAAKRKLISTMINIEHGARVVDDAGAPLDAPHDPFPVVTVPPVTKLGLPVVYHLKASVGVVFYTAGPDFQLEPFVEELSAALRAFGHGHLTKRSRAAAVSPCAVTKHVQPLAEERTAVRDHSAPSTARAGDPFPARLMVTLALYNELMIPHVSVGAVFTWIFASLTGAVDAGRGIGDASTLNRFIASAAYDDAGIIATKKETVFGLKLEDLRLPALPFDVKPMFPMKENIHAYQDNGPPPFGGRGYQVCMTAGLVRFTRYTKSMRAATLKTWESLKMACPAQCDICNLPLWGVVYVMNPTVEQELAERKVWRTAACHICTMQDKIWDLCLITPSKFDMYRLLAVHATQAAAFAPTSFAKYGPLLAACAEAVQYGWPNLVVGVGARRFILREQGDRFSLRHTAIASHASLPVLEVPTITVH